MGKQTWVAFECYALADNTEEQTRLFTYGYEQVAMANVCFCKYLIEEETKFANL